MNEADFIVVRGVEGQDGVWYDLDTMCRSTAVGIPSVWQRWELHPTGRFEVRDDDGAVAEVWAPDGWEVLYWCW